MRIHGANIAHLGKVIAPLILVLEPIARKLAISVMEVAEVNIWSYSSRIDNFK